MRRRTGSTIRRPTASTGAVGHRVRAVPVRRRSGPNTRISGLAAPKIQHRVSGFDTEPQLGRHTARVRAVHENPLAQATIRSGRRVHFTKNDDRILIRRHRRSTQNPSTHGTDRQRENGDDHESRSLHHSTCHPEVDDCRVGQHGILDTRQTFFGVEARRVVASAAKRERNLHVRTGPPNSLANCRPSAMPSSLLMRSVIRRLSKSWPLSSSPSRMYSWASSTPRARSSPNCHVNNAASSTCRRPFPSVPSPLSVLTLLSSVMFLMAFRSSASKAQASGSAPQRSRSRTLRSRHSHKIPDSPLPERPFSLAGGGG